MCAKSPVNPIHDVCNWVIWYDALFRKPLEHFCFIANIFHTLNLCGFLSDWLTAEYVRKYIHWDIILVKNQVGNKYIIDEHSRLTFLLFVFCHTCINLLEFTSCMFFTFPYSTIQFLFLMIFDLFMYCCLEIVHIPYSPSHFKTHILLMFCIIFFFNSSSHDCHLVSFVIAIVYLLSFPLFYMVFFHQLLLKLSFHHSLCLTF